MKFVYGSVMAVATCRWREGDVWWLEAQSPVGGRYETCEDCDG